MLLDRRPRWISEARWKKILIFRDDCKEWRRQFRRFFLSPRLAAAYRRHRIAISKGDWVLAREETLKLKEIAVSVNDGRVITELVRKLPRLECYREAKELAILEIEARPLKDPREWRGQTLEGKRVFIDLYPSSRQGLSVGYRRARLIEDISSQTSLITINVEPRLVPTYERTFPGIRVVNLGTGPKDIEADYLIGPDHLMAYCLPVELPPTTGGAFLKADAALTTRLREAYEARYAVTGRKPLLGICWYSSHHGKDLPELSDWRELVQQNQSGYISLQYGKRSSQDIEYFGPGIVYHDESIDQLINMDDFAAQLCALDGVLTITNTVAHVAGALNVPTVVLSDNQLRREWPVTNPMTPWYPNLRVVVKGQRHWSEVLKEAHASLLALIASKDSHKS